VQQGGFSVKEKTVKKRSRNATEIREELFSRYPQLEFCAETFDRTFQELLRCFRQGGKLLVAGNGGSAADSEHIAGELMKSFLFAREPDSDTVHRLESLYGDDGRRLSKVIEGALPVIPLTSMPALSTAFANDAEPDVVFAQMVNGLGKPGDVFLGISTSGNSHNIKLALMTARAKGLMSVLLTGGDGGVCKSLADVTVCVPEKETFKIQELHLPVYHALCAMAEAELFVERQ